MGWTMPINSLSGSQGSNSGSIKSTQNQLSSQSTTQKIQQEINQNQSKNNSSAENSAPQKIEENKGIASRVALANAIEVEKNKEVKTRSIEKTPEIEVSEKEKKEKVEEAVASVNDYIQNIRNRILEFTVDGGSGRMVVSVIDTDTRKTIRQIPPEEMLRIAENVGKDKGWLVEQKA